MNKARSVFARSQSAPKASGIIQAEIVRTKGSAVQWFPLIGLSIGITSSTLAFWSAEGHDASGALAWQAMYVTGMAAPLLALLAGLAEDREKANRYGGTDIRPVSPYAIRAARIGVLIVVSALFHLMNFGSSWALTILDGREGANSLLVAGGLAFMCSISTLCIFSLVARYFSILMTLLAAVVYQAAGTLLSESALWNLLPPTWPVRLLLPVLGVHSNAVPLTEGELLAQETPLQGIVLNSLFALVTLSLTVFARGRQRKVTNKKNTQAQPQQSISPAQFSLDSVYASPDFSGRNSPDNLALALSSIRMALFRSSISWLLFAVLAVFGMMAIFYPASYISGFYTFFVLPLGAGLLPIVSWKLLSSAWRVTVLENAKTRVSYLMWHSILLVFLAIVVGVLHTFAGGNFPETVKLVVLWSTTGVVLATISTVLCVSYGVGLTIAWSIFITVLSATLGGDVLAESILWVVALPAWPEIANTPERLIFAVITELLVLGLTVRWFFVALRKFERSS